MYKFYKTTLLAGMVAACSVLLTSAITAPPQSTPKNGENNSIILPTNSKSILSQCGDYYTYDPTPDKYGLIPVDYSHNYIPVPPMVIPVYGYMSQKPIDIAEAQALPQGENPYNVAQINRAMWDGYVFIWTTKTLPAETHNYLKEYANKWNKSHNRQLIVLTWNGKDIPKGRQIVFSSWNISQSCMNFSEPAFEEYMVKQKEENGSRTITPVPTATLDANGELPKYK